MASSNTAKPLEEAVVTVLVMRRFLFLLFSLATPAFEDVSELSRDSDLLEEVLMLADGVEVLDSREEREDDDADAEGADAKIEEAEDTDGADGNVDGAAVAVGTAVGGPDDKDDKDNEDEETEAEAVAEQEKDFASNARSLAAADEVDTCFVCGTSCSDFLLSFPWHSASTKMATAGGAALSLPPPIRKVLLPPPAARSLLLASRRSWLARFAAEGRGPAFQAVAATVFSFSRLF